MGFLYNLEKKIVGFEIEINRIEGKWKLNQNHSSERQKIIINRLETRNEYNSKEIAELLKKNLLN
ncbi:transcriptional regulator [Jeotgalibacillus soli]|uniref:Transcriptional regulator n=1 Tax=Jeotgalibacillus soli TaxID=889306 RepID=A0A0C2S5C8_9BACL|nr:transcriptional regulator [Jeotgalibacillus soli]